MEILVETLKHTVMITAFVFGMMVLVDYLNVVSDGRIARLLTDSRRFKQYFISSALGSTPGCLGAFMNASFYMHGFLSFGAIVAGMIATSGDEAFIMLAMFPKEALLIFIILFGIGFAAGWITDRIPYLKTIQPPLECSLGQIHEDEECRWFDWSEILSHMSHITLARFTLFLLLGSLLYILAVGIIGPENWTWERITLFSLLIISVFVIFTVPDHYLEEHIWEHIAKKHLWRIAAWTFGALLVVNIGLSHWELESFVKAHMGWVLLSACLVGLIPESGPHLIFVMLFAQGVIPFSVFLGSCIVQDGHGMLPLLSYSVRDSLLIKTVNLVLGLLVAGALYLLGF